MTNVIKFPDKINWINPSDPDEVNRIPAIEGDKPYKVTANYSMFYALASAAGREPDLGSSFTYIWEWHCDNKREAARLANLIINAKIPGIIETDIEEIRDNQKATRPHR